MTSAIIILSPSCHSGLLCSFILFSYIAMTSSMTLDLTELRNKVSKIKVNPRGKLWATGHFMGKKSVLDSSFMESAFEDVNIPTEVGVLSPLNNVENLQSLLIEMLKMTQDAQRKQPLHMLVQTAQLMMFFHSFRQEGDPV
uniref:Neuromedin Ba n=1 Tax=Sphaeramia orbicularis TaxID=375764 RepID=A0A673CPB1_9TELE